MYVVIESLVAVLCGDRANSCHCFHWCLGEGNIKHVYLYTRRSREQASAVFRQVYYMYAGLHPTFPCLAKLSTGGIVKAFVCLCTKGLVVGNKYRLFSTMILCSTTGGCVGGPDNSQQSEIASRISGKKVPMICRH